MKFFPKILKCILFVSFFALAEARAVAKVNDKRKVSEEVAALELEEFRDSTNLETKEKLARAYWCSGRKGLAVEKWLWLNQFFRNHPRRPSWKQNLSQAEKHPKVLSQELSCPR